ncbi:MAG: GMC oxidoreductase [Planctomycetota bacterium]|nr:GMC oxidoreductase [Planctomycetota bacterium]
MDCDLAVIGSGFGGAVVAMRAAAAGMRVIVLERGPRMTAQAYENLRRGRLGFLNSRRKPGIVDHHLMRGLFSLSGNAVGGGSHIYTGVTLPAPKEVFDDRWPDSLRRNAMAKQYQRVAEMIRPGEIPHPIPRTLALESIASRMNATVSRLPLAMDWPERGPQVQAAPRPRGVRSELVKWMRGGGTATKRTLNHTYLKELENSGGVIRPLHEVRTIAAIPDGYRVTYRRRRSGGHEDGSIRSPRVVLALGTLNTVRLLLRCRQISGALPRISAALGRCFYTNGDFGALLVGPNLHLGADDGPPVTAWIDFWNSDRLYIMETGTSPVLGGLIRAMLGPFLRLRDIRKPIEEGPASRYAWSFGVMGLEENPGTLSLNRGGRMTYLPDTGGDRIFEARRMARLRELASATGATLLTPPQIPGFRHSVTIHPLGGAALAETPDGGVTNPAGEVFGYPGLYVADGSLLPTPTGRPPSMTISALAEHVAENLIATC